MFSNGPAQAKPTARASGRRAEDDGQRRAEHGPAGDAGEHGAEVTRRRRRGRPSENQAAGVDVLATGRSTSDSAERQHLGRAPARRRRPRAAPTSLPTITRSRCGSRSSRARNVPPENSVAIRAMNVTKTKKPTNDAPTANASVPPPVPARARASCRRGRPAARSPWPPANTVSVATTAKTTATAATTTSGAPAQQAQQLGVDDPGHRAPALGDHDEGEVAVLERRAQRAQLDEHDPGVEGGPVDGGGEVASGDAVGRRRPARPSATSTPWPAGASSGDAGRRWSCAMLGHDGEPVAAGRRGGRRSGPGTATDRCRSAPASRRPARAR